MARRLESVDVLAGGIAHDSDDLETAAETCADPAQLVRALEPFCSRSPSRERPGLGLAVVYGILKAHRGRSCSRTRPRAVPG